MNVLPDRRGKGSILIVDDEESIRFAFHKHLTDLGYSVQAASEFDEALDLLAENRYEVIILDIILRGASGMDLFKRIKEEGRKAAIIIITGAPNIDTATEAVRLGAYDYLLKPVKLEKLRTIVGKAIEEVRLKEERERYKSLIEGIFMNIDDGIIVVDENLKINQLNTASSRICGFRKEHIGRSLKDIYPECQGRCLSALKTSMSEMKDIELYRIECRRSNPKKTVTIRFSPLVMDDDTFKGGMMVIHDETRINDLEISSQQRGRLQNIIGSSKKMQEVYNLIEMLSDVDTTVLITGESGTGKELVAEAIHYSGSRRNRPLVKINCSALPETLIESELFGHIKGAFTGATTNRVGRLELANGGTLFLDEIGELSPRIQVKLLRFLQEKEFERLGETTPVRVDVRLLAATNRDLLKTVRAGMFREDLYFRLKVMEIHLPPLRERKEDIPALVDYFIGKMCKKFKKEFLGITDEVMRLFLEYDWPGNVRELENLLERLCLVTGDGYITTDCLPNEWKETRGSHGLLSDTGISRDSIIRAIEKSAGNKAMAARMLGISRRTLYRKMKEMKIPLKAVSEKWKKG